MTRRCRSTSGPCARRGCHSAALRRVARPNILMFGDDTWATARVVAQDARFDAFASSHVTDATVVVELERARPFRRSASSRSTWGTAPAAP